MQALRGVPHPHFANNPEAVVHRPVTMLLELRCCSCSSSNASQKNAEASSLQAKLDLGSIGLRKTLNTSSGDCVSSTGLGDGSSGGGNGGGDGGGNHGGFQGGWGPSFSSTCALVAVEKLEEYPQVRSFCCLNVGPVYDGSRWRPFSEVERQGDSTCEDYWRPCLLPSNVQADLMWHLISETVVTKETLTWLREQIEGWYHSQGYVLTKVMGFSGLENGRLCCRISEGTIVDVRVLFKDDKGNDIVGRTQRDVVLRELPQAVNEGMPYNTNAIKEAMQRVFRLHLFEKVYVEFKRNEELGGITLDFLVQERSQDGCYFQTGLSFVSSESGRPVLTSVRPAATLSVEHRNISGMNRTLHGYIHSNDLLSPQDDSRFKLEYVHPYVDGVKNPRDRIFRVSCYNSRKLTAVFFDPRSQEHVPAVWVDRAGLKTGITEKFSKESKLTYGFVIEEVATRDDIGTIQTADHELAAGSDGIDHVPFFHVKITRDNTRTVHGSRVGALDTFQVDQGAGFGTKTSSFNKHQFSTTRFIPLQSQKCDSFPLMIVRARYGGILGDIPRYRAFTNGGPYALRGSNVGELGNCTSFLELMGELRVPVQKHYAYGFVESFTELDAYLYQGQSFRELLKGAGKGVLLGAGMKIGNVRAEGVFDCSTKTGSINLQMGERI